MECLLAPRRQPLDIWFRPHGERAPEVAFEVAARRARAVILCVPASPVGALGERLRPLLPPDAPVFSIAKGLDEQGRPAADALAGALGDGRPYGVIYGPMIAEEIRAGRPAYAQVAGQGAAVATALTLFAGSNLSLESSRDAIGLSWSAILKNLYAIAFGGADGLLLGDNTRGLLATRALAEMDAIVRERGGETGTAQGLAGLGDLVTTATSAGSHHHELGRGLVRGTVTRPDGEGVHTLAMLARHRPFDERPHVLLRTVRRMVEQPAAAATVLRAYLELRG